MKVAYATIDGEIREHELTFDGHPDPSCYNCEGSGKFITGPSCSCRFTCDYHETICEAEDV
jgi:hypothetical protein